ncbi:alanine racemase [Uliginosibacterium sediminicola]|uniref:Alanine racemase n=1 Tax=Uliginosibacterium sediminicola TaxID=2024550 RepID=A0ABU9Z0U3_9RHOO
MRPIFARIDRAAFRSNYLLAKARAPQARAWCVVKANAYGHGLLRCAEAVRDVADGFALLDISEALQLRQAQFAQPILLLEGFFDAEGLQQAAEYDLSVVLHSAPQLRLLETEALPRSVDVFLKINTGMNRLGFRPEEVPALIARLRTCSAVRSITAMTHFACADGAGIDAQWARFEQALAGSDLPRSAANSAALLRFPHSHADWVRPGIVLYGASPMPQLESAVQLGLKPVMSLESELIAIQYLQAGDQLGYGASFVATEPTCVGIVACGYGDGYPRHAGTGTPILVDGILTRTLGRVSMDMLACDLSSIPAAQIGSRVVLWGDGLPADEVATAAGTISYELFCALAPRVPVRD